MARTLPVPGLANHPENIVAFRNENDLRDFIEAVKPFPYWQAWAAVACLSGPRWAEQAWLKCDDVYLSDGYFRVTSREHDGKKIGTKTGRERNVPIEKSIAFEIVKRHLSERNRQRKNKKAAPSEKSPFLFPSLLPDNPHSPRRLTPPGVWSSSSNWRDCWDEITPQAKDRKNKKAAWWDYGPKEWRHTFGTALGMCGRNALEISRAMGNSPQIAERHYIAVTSIGRRWGFQW